MQRLLPIPDMPRAATLFAALMLGLSAAAPGARAEVPRVVADIAPIHALAAQVMGDLGAPDLLLPPDVSPHDYALRPSDARALEGADIVVWMGPDLAPWLETPVETLAGDAAHVVLLASEGVRLLEFREGARFAAHDHDAHAHEEEHAHADEHAHDEDHAQEEEHASDHASDHGHDHAHGAHDPHAWLDPANAMAFVDAIAGALAAADPANAETYAANAAAARADLAALTAEIAETVAPARDAGFVVFHDAYQYFERAFGIEAAGAISLGDASSPSAARLQEVRATIEALGAPCIAAEPQFDPGIVAAVAEGTQARAAVLDPIGVDLAPGPALYGEMMRGLAASLAACAAGS